MTNISWLGSKISKYLFFIPLASQEYGHLNIIDHLITYLITNKYLKIRNFKYLCLVRTY